MRDRLRDLLARELGQAPPEEAVQECTRLCATELDRVFATVLPNPRLSELSSRLEKGEFDAVLLLTAEYPWSGQVVDFVVETLVQRVVARRTRADDDSGRAAWPPPPTTLEEGRALVRELTSGRGGVQALAAWPSLPDAEPEVLRLIADRVEAEAGVRLALLADRAGTLDVCEAAVDEVVASVIDDSGGAEGLGLWGSQLVDVDAATVDGGTALRAKRWSSSSLAEPVTPPDAATIRFNDELLNRCDLATLHPGERGPLLESMYEELQMRVGATLSESLDDSELAEFERLFDAKDEQASAAWLATHCPEYPQVIHRHATALETELRAAAQTLLTALGTIPGADAR